MNDPPDPGGSVLSTDQFLSPQVAYNVTLMSHEESSVDTDQTVSTIMDWSASTNRKRSKCSKICKNCNKKKRKHKMAGKSDGCLCTESDDIISKKSNNSITSDKQCAPSTLPSSESGALGFPIAWYKGHPTKPPIHGSPVCRTTLLHLDVECVVMAPETRGNRRPISP
ncbi:hypothetical protein ACJJTC_017219 [Scirpophaga incertulas]